MSVCVRVCLCLSVDLCVCLSAYVCLPHFLILNISTTSVTCLNSLLLPFEREVSYLSPDLVVQHFYVNLLLLYILFVYCRGWYYLILLRFMMRTQHHEFIYYYFKSFPIVCWSPLIFQPPSWRRKSSPGPLVSSSQDLSYSIIRYERMYSSRRELYCDVHQ